MKIDFLAPNPAERKATLREIGPRANLRTTEKISKKGPDADLVWLHGDTEHREDWELDQTQTELLRRYVEGGGRVLLTGPAACLVGAIAGEERPPEVHRSVEPLADQDSEGLRSTARGVMPMPGHPLFYRAVGGRMFYERRPGEEYAEAVYPGGCRPQQGEVVAVEKLADECRCERAVIVEYKVGQGRVVSVGAPLSFIEPSQAEGESPAVDSLLESRARFVGDLFDYAMNDHAAEQGAPWRSEDTGAWIRWDSSKLLTQPEPVPAPLDEGLLATADEVLEYELALGDGQVLYGDTSSEAFEVWRQPFRAFRDFGYAFSAGDADWVSATSIQASSRVHLDRVVQRFTGQDIDIGCCVALAPRGFQVRWRNLGETSIRIRVTGVANLGLASPYPKGSLGDLDFVSAAKGAELKVADPVLGYGAWMRFDRIPKRSSLADRSTDCETMVGFTREFKLPKNGDLAMELGGIVRDSFAVGGLASQKVGDASQSLSDRLSITLEDAELDAALLGLRSRAAFALRAYDGQSRGLTAGRLQVGEATLPAGRFVGRGSLALGTSQLHWGFTTAVREHLDLLQRFQDVSGQIFDQLTVSGVIKLGDETATGEFVQLVASYLTWTGDHESVFELWPAVRSALAWLEARGWDLEQGVLVGPAFHAGARIAELVGEADQAKVYAEQATEMLAPFSMASAEDGVASVTRPNWEESAEALRQAWRRGEPWDRVAQAGPLRIVAEQAIGLREDRESGTLVLDPSFEGGGLEGGPAVVKFDSLSVQGRTWSGELRRDADGIALTVHQDGPALEICCKSVEDHKSEDGFSKIVFEGDTVLRFSVAPQN